MAAIEKPLTSSSTMSKYNTLLIKPSVWRSLELSKTKPGRGKKPQHNHPALFLFTCLILQAILSPHQLSAQDLQPQVPEEGRRPLAESKIRVRKIKITGNTVIRTEELADILDPVAGKELDLAELQQVADAITAEFRARGYSFTRAYIPAQEVKDGLVEISVLESRVGEIVVKGNKNYSTEFIKKGFTPVVRDGAVKQRSLEKSLLVLNEYPDLKA
ncbi:MAG: POTRA domain-containing protein, partial [Candidatus Binatia bacterium]